MHLYELVVITIIRFGKTVSMLEALRFSLVIGHEPGIGHQLSPATITSKHCSGSDISATLSIRMQEGKKTSPPLHVNPGE